MKTAYGANLPVAGEYNGNLDNSGEEIRVRLPSPLDIDIQRFEYDDDPDENWPVEPDNGVVYFIYHSILYILFSQEEIKFFI